MSWEHLAFLAFEGFIIKSIASLDGTIAKIPVVSEITKRRAGEAAFVLGNLVALALAIGLAILLSSIFSGAAWFRFVVGGVILLSATVTFFDLWPGSSPAKGEEMEMFGAVIAGDRFLKLAAVGFVISAITLFDDFAAVIPLFGNGWMSTAAVTAGILVSTALQIVLVLFFSDLLDRVPYRKEISSAGLVIYAILVMVGVV